MRHRSSYLTVRSITQETQSLSLLVLLLLLFYVRLSKNSFSSCSSGLFLKADAKVRLFSETPKLFKKNFIQNIKVFAFFDNTENYTLLYYIRTPINTSRVLQNESHLSSDKFGICRAHTNTIKILETCWGSSFFCIFVPEKAKISS